MNIPGRSNTVLILAAGLVGGPMIPTAGHADEKRPPTIETVSLRDLDVSRDITPVTRPKELTLKPRTTPGYDQLRSALWSGTAECTRPPCSPTGPTPTARARTASRSCTTPSGATISSRSRTCSAPGPTRTLPDKHGDTPLGRAIWSGHEKAVALLLKYGADPLRQAEGRDTRPGLRPMAWRTRRSSPCWRRSGQTPSSPRRSSRRRSCAGPTRCSAPPGSGRRGAEQALVYTADGKQLIAGDERGGIRFFDARTGELRNVIDAHDVRGAGAGAASRTRPSWSRRATTGPRASGTPTRRGN